MCIAEINASTLPCHHRWYRLSRSCSPSTNLSNCPNRLALEGWEIRCEFCPYCAGWSDPASYRLVNQDRRQSVSSLSRNPSLSMSRRESRSNSLVGHSRVDSRMSATVATAGEKNRALNARLDAYLSASPEKSSPPESFISRLSRSDTMEPTTPSSSGGSISERDFEQSYDNNVVSASGIGKLKKNLRRTKRFGSLFK